MAEPTHEQMSAARQLQPLDAQFLSLCLGKKKKKKIHVQPQGQQTVWGRFVGGGGFMRASEKLNRNKPTIV